jgi:hypothetical protein
MRTQAHKAAILWLISGGFLAIIVFSWLDEVTNFPRLIGGIDYVSNWRESALETLIVIAVAIPVVLMTRLLLNRLYYLEGFLSVCAWCKRVDHDGEWIPMNQYFERNFQMETSHAICSACLLDANEELRKGRPE